MNFSPISALSPLDGRYASKVNTLRPLVSELGYMHRRVQVEIAWFIALSDAGFDEFVAMRQARDATLAMPVLILPAVQINVRAGQMPPAEDNGVAYVKIPLNAL